MVNSLRVQSILLAPGNGASFYDDQEAIRQGAVHDGFLYVGKPLTAGFSSIRQPATSVSIGLKLSNGATVWGDMMNVVYAGAGGRDPVLNALDTFNLVRERLEPVLVGLNVLNFEHACALVFGAQPVRLPLAVEYGVSQALLEAAALATLQTKAEVLCRELNLPRPHSRVPLYAQSGEDRRINVDKMILKSVDIIPHGLTNCRELFGDRGEVFMDYVQWVAKRVRELGSAGYHPKLHFDLYGWIGIGLGLDPKVIATYIAQVADLVPDFDLQIECPADYGSTDKQLEGYAAIVEHVKRIGTSAKVVADEYCNSFDDIRRFVDAKAAHVIQIKMPDVGTVLDSAKSVLYCKNHGVGAYLGGSASETDISARISVHVAMATGADMILAKPGLGVDEGITIVGNEQNRLLAELESSSH